MAGRILTLQRQVRELGRLRAGLTETRTNKDGKEVTFPTSSKTWILTAANRDYLDAAAQLWGGDVLEWQPVGNGPKAWRLITATPLIDAILPPGDPLSQHQEMWSRGGCQRRCDGEREQLSNQPCLCRAQHGDDFHEQKQGTVCDIHTRLNVFLPDLPDLGVWRVETKGFWPANHIAGYIDMIKGQVGPQVLVPVRLRIEPRTKVKAGKTSQYIEIVVELRSRASFAEILAEPQVLAIGGPADDRAIEGTAARPAIESAAASQPQNGNGHQAATSAVWRQRFGQAQTLDELRSMWTRAGNDNALDDETRAAYKAAGEKLLKPAPAPAVVDEGAAVDLDAPPADGYSERQHWDALIANAPDLPTLRPLMEAMNEAGVKDNALRQAFWAKQRILAAGAAASAGGGPGEVLTAAQPAVETAEVEPDRDDMWGAILRLGGERGWNTAETSRQFRDNTDTDVTAADGWALQLFRDALKTGAVA